MVVSKTVTTLYKFTRQDNTSGFETILTWGRGVSHTAQGVGVRLRTHDVIHAYTHPLLAVLLNPIYGIYEKPKLWRCEGEIVADDHALTVGVKTLTTSDEISLPTMTTEQRISFAIRCAQQVSQNEKWNEWAESWLGGQTRSALAVEHMTIEEIPWVAWAAIRTSQASTDAAVATATAWVVSEAAPEVDLIALANWYS